MSSVLDIDSGVPPIVDDECVLDPTLFPDFVVALTRKHEGFDHGPLSALLEGFIGVCWVLLDRGGNTGKLLALGSGTRKFWTEHTTELARSMPR